MRLSHSKEIQSQSSDFMHPIGTVPSAKPSLLEFDLKWGTQVRSIARAIGKISRLFLEPAEYVELERACKQFSKYAKHDQDVCRHYWTFAPCRRGKKQCKITYLDSIKMLMAKLNSLKFPRHAKPGDSVPPLPRPKGHIWTTLQVSKCRKRERA